MESINVVSHNYYLFVSGGKKWGVDISAIREVSELADTLCPVPHSQTAVMGYLNVRGDIHQLISFKSLLAGKKVDEVSDGLVLFFKESVGPSLGVYVDDACEIKAIENNDVEQWEAISTKKLNDEFDMAEYLTSSVYRNKDELIPLIDPYRIAEAINIR